ncbi:MAG: SusC/RagA family TonB-linked outer membrane protein [Bacteroidota bacterium]
MRKLLIMFIMLIGFLGNSLAQKTVSGTVTNEESNPLVGVTVMLQGTSIGTLTNADGGFSFSVPADAQTLVFSFIGMKTNEVAIGDQTTFNVVMAIDIGMLEEVIVIGYGTAKKKDLTGAVTRLNAEDLLTESTSNITSMLRGSIPGLSVALTTDPKGLSSPNSMLVRGETSLAGSGANAPLIVVDGMIYYGDLADINPVDIESFDILKDASSAAIYGARAANGVIIITTKKGVKGKPVISINTSTGFAYSSPSNLEMMNGEQFIARRIAGFEANERNQILIGPGYYKNYNNLPAGVTLDMWKAYDGSSAATDLDGVWLNRIGFAAIEIVNYKAGRETDFAQYTWQTGLTQDYTASISGSSEAVSYYMSLGYTNNEGIQYNDSFDTYRARINLESVITDWLKVGTNTQMAFRDESPISINNNLYNTPYSKMYEDDGVTLEFAPSGYVNAPNYWLTMTHQDRYIKYNTFNSKIYGTLTLPYGFSFTSEFIPRFNWDRNYQSWSSAHPLWEVQGGRAARQNTTIFEWQLNNILKWNKTFDVHNFDVTVVQNAEKYQYWQDYMYRQNFLPSDVLGYHRMQAAAEDISITSNDEVSTGDALLARVNYTLMSRYNLTSSFRRDGYSAFGQANPRATFWSVAGGWTISEENFFQVDWIETLKLRLSYGTNGNRGVGRYDALSNLSTGKFLLITGGTPGYVSQLYTSRMANKELKWERTTALNTGLDFAIFKGRLRGNIEAYYMVTKDLLIPRLLPNVTGYSSVFSNMGQVDNKGFEFSLNSVNISKQDIGWTSDFSVTFNRNKIVHLYGDYAPDPETGEMVEVNDITNEWFIGHAIDEVWDYRTLGIWQADETAEADLYSRDPGDYKLEDLDGDGYYTNADKQFQGYTRPPFRVTFRNDFQYKDFELSIKMYSNLGHYRTNNHLRNNDAFYDRSTYYNVPYWTPENPGNKWGRIDSYETGFSVREKASFVRIDNISLSYNVPKSFLEKFKIVSCRLSVVSDNPIVWAPGWSWMDPENDSYTPSYISFKLNLTL